MTALLIALGGGLGSLGRYYVSGLVQQRFSSSFPGGTLAVNLLGCLLLGMLMALVTDRQLLGPNWRLFLGIGFLGGFTTFSTFGYETFMLLDGGGWISALTNIFISIVGGLFMVFCGRGLVLWLNR